jgi:predicted O-methyltransferase YrrM
MMTSMIILVLSLATIALTWHALKWSAKRRQRSVFGAWPVKRVPLSALDPVFEKTAFGSSLETLASIIGNDGFLGSTSDTEAWILAVLAKKSRRIFEFGTCSGRTTYIMGVNSPEESEIFTITLAPEQLAAYVGGAGDDAASRAAALKESQFTSFYYSDTPVAKKVTQLFGDSKAFDDAPHHRRFDLIFIDGSHAYSYVVSDTEKALKMIKPGGMILWHDYKGPRVAAGVFRALNEYSRTLDLMHIAGTTLVAYRAAA